MKVDQIWQHNLWHCTIITGKQRNFGTMPCATVSLNGVAEDEQTLHCIWQPFCVFNSLKQFSNYDIRSIILLNQNSSASAPRTQRISKILCKCVFNQAIKRSAFLQKMALEKYDTPSTFLTNSNNTNKFKTFQFNQWKIVKYYGTRTTLYLGITLQYTRRTQITLQKD